MCLTIVAGQTPARSHAGHARGKHIAGLSQAHGGNVGAHAGGGGQLDQSDVIVDGAGVPFGVGEDLVRRRGEEGEGVKGVSGVRIKMN